ncbi:hypothetical protein V1514DRAFT_273491, partial [Lipomyces japonicus]|uniref:uncharacterized protein n=1 Tax=Lipomyces japonicus TaxID=56871 RepID=UPI0034CFCBAB
DNQSAMHLVQHGCSIKIKHINIKYHYYLREKVQDGTIPIVYCNTKDVIAAMFTKGLGTPQFTKLRE